MERSMDSMKPGERKIVRLVNRDGIARWYVVECVGVASQDYGPVKAGTPLTIEWPCDPPKA